MCVKPAAVAKIAARWFVGSRPADSIFGSFQPASGQNGCFEKTSTEEPGMRQSCSSWSNVHHLCWKRCRWSPIQFDTRGRLQRCFHIVPCWVLSKLIVEMNGIVISYPVDWWWSNSSSIGISRCRLVRNEDCQGHWMQATVVTLNPVWKEQKGKRATASTG